MKKYFSLASALMLALSMNSCSNDLDEVQAPAEQQVEMHKLHLSASAPQSSETRSYVEGVAGKDDAIKITGWKEGDVIWGIYQDEEYINRVGFLLFSFNTTTKDFDSEATSIDNEAIKYFITGNLDIDNITDDSWDGSLGAFFNVRLKDKFVNINVPNNTCDIPMYGQASVVDGQLTTSMNLADDMAFVCLHNNSTESIDVTLALKYNSSETLSYINYSYLHFGSGSFLLNEASTKNDPATATVTTIPAGEKAYLPLVTRLVDTTVKIVVNGDYEHPIAERVESLFTPGKVYKLNYGVPGSTGTQLTKIGTEPYAVYYGIKWVQLWEDGPKFAECNVGFAGTTVAPEKLGGYYTWGGSIDINQNSNRAYNDGMDVLTGTDDTATNLWGAAWRMPTQDELDGLLTNCDSEWTTVNGALGRKYTGKGAYASNSIFLPAAGYYDNYLEAVKLPSSGYYRSSTPSSSSNEYGEIEKVAYRLYFNVEGQEVSKDNRKDGYSVRPVYIY